MRVIDAVVRYLHTLARPDGGFGWEDQPDSHLTPTFAAIGCFHLLGRDVPDRKAHIDFVRTHHPLRGPYAETGASELDLRSFLLQQIQALRWLGDDAADFVDEVRSWTGPASYLYEIRKYPVFREEALAFVGRKMFGLPPGEVDPAWVEYLLERRRPNGSFNSTRAADGGDGHVLNTFWGLLALDALDRVPAGDPLTPATIEWLNACRLPNGGFTYAPGAEVGGIDDVAYARAALRSLALLGGKPDDPGACARYILSLQNLDGGFGDRPGVPSSAVATYYALDALNALGVLERAVEGAFEAEADGRARGGAGVVTGTGASAHIPGSAGAAVSASAVVPTRRREAVLPPGLKAFTIQLEAPGWGSPVEAVELARSLGIHLWGAKNASPGWVERAQEVAEERGVDVKFFVSNEEYGSYIELPGMGSFNHLSDPFAPAGVDMGPYLKGESPHWNDFRKLRLEPLWRAKGRMIWQISHDEPFTRALLDDTLHRGGYGAISTFHFGCTNMAFTVPLLFRWRHDIPFVSLQDAHGLESWWWSHHLVGFRTLFLAEEPTWDAWLEALDRHWVVAARHDHKTRFRTRLLGGGPGVQERVRELEPTWRWWRDDAPEILKRPFASLVPVRAGDPFEAGGPEDGGVTLRLRLWWKANHLAHLIEPAVEVVQFDIDGKPADPRPVRTYNERGKLIDAYEAVRLPAGSGRHSVALVVRHTETGEVARLTLDVTA